MAAMDIISVISSSEEEIISNVINREVIVQITSKFEQIFVKREWLQTNPKCFPYEEFESFLEEIKISTEKQTAKTKCFFWRSLMKLLESINVPKYDLNKDIKYNIILGSIMAEYINFRCELIKIEIENEEITQREMEHEHEVLESYLIAVFNGNYEHISFALMQIRSDKLHNAILFPLFKKILEHKQNVDDHIAYVRLLLCFRKWQSIALNLSSTKESEIIIKDSKIITETVSKILPPRIPKYQKDTKIFLEILPIVAEKYRKNATRALLQTKLLNIEKAVTSFFDVYIDHLEKRNIPSMNKQRCNKTTSIEQQQQVNNNYPTINIDDIDDKGMDPTKDIYTLSSDNENCVILSSSSDEELKALNISNKFNNLSVNSVNRKDNSLAPKVLFSTKLLNTVSNSVSCHSPTLNINHKSSCREDIIEEYQNDIVEKVDKTFSFIQAQKSKQLELDADVESEKELLDPKNDGLRKKKKTRKVLSKLHKYSTKFFDHESDTDLTGDESISTTRGLRNSLGKSKISHISGQVSSTTNSDLMIAFNENVSITQSRSRESTQSPHISTSTICEVEPSNYPLCGLEKEDEIGEPSSTIAPTFITDKNLKLNESVNKITNNCPSDNIIIKSLNTFKINEKTCSTVTTNKIIKDNLINRDSKINCYDVTKKDLSSISSNDGIEVDNRNQCSKTIPSDILEVCSNISNEPFLDEDSLAEQNKKQNSLSNDLEDISEDEYIPQSPDTNATNFPAEKSAVSFLNKNKKSLENISSRNTPLDIESNNIDSPVTEHIVLDNANVVSGCFNNYSKNMPSIETFVESTSNNTVYELIVHKINPNFLYVDETFDAADDISNSKMQNKSRLENKNSIKLDETNHQNVEVVRNIISSDKTHKNKVILDGKQFRTENNQRNCRDNNTILKMEQSKYIFMGSDKSNLYKNPDPPNLEAEHISSVASVNTLDTKTENKKALVSLNKSKSYIVESFERNRKSETVSVNDNNDLNIGTIKSSNDSLTTNREKQNEQHSDSKTSKDLYSIFIDKIMEPNSVNESLSANTSNLEVPNNQTEILQYNTSNIQHSVGIESFGMHAINSVETFNSNLNINNNQNEQISGNKQNFECKSIIDSTKSENTVIPTNENLNNIPTVEADGEISTEPHINIPDKSTVLSNTNKCDFESYKNEYQKGDKNSKDIIPTILNENQYEINNPGALVISNLNKNQDGLKEVRIKKDYNLTLIDEVISNGQERKLIISNENLCELKDPEVPDPYKISNNNQVSLEELKLVKDHIITSTSIGNQREIKDKVSSNIDQSKLTILNKNLYELNGPEISIVPSISNENQYGLKNAVIMNDHNITPISIGNQCEIKDEVISNGEESKPSFLIENQYNVKYTEEDVTTISNKNQVNLKVVKDHNINAISTGNQFEIKNEVNSNDEASKLTISNENVCILKDSEIPVVPLILNDNQCGLEEIGIVNDYGTNSISTGTQCEIKDEEVSKGERRRSTILNQNQPELKDFEELFVDTISLKTRCELNVEIVNNQCVTPTAIEIQCEKKHDLISNGTKIVPTILDTTPCNSRDLEVQGLATIPNENQRAEVRIVCRQGLPSYSTENQCKRKDNESLVAEEFETNILNEKFSDIKEVNNVNNQAGSSISIANPCKINDVVISNGKGIYTTLNENESALEESEVLGVKTVSTENQRNLKAVPIVDEQGVTKIFINNKCEFNDEETENIEDMKFTVSNENQNADRQDELLTESFCKFKDKALLNNIESKPRNLFDNQCDLEAQEVLSVATISTRNQCRLKEVGTADIKCETISFGNQTEIKYEVISNSEESKPTNLNDSYESKDIDIKLPSLNEVLREKHCSLSASMPNNRKLNAGRSSDIQSEIIKPNQCDIIAERKLDSQSASTVSIANLNASQQSISTLNSDAIIGDPKVINQLNPLRNDSKILNFVKNLNLQPNWIPYVAHENSSLDNDSLDKNQVLIFNINENELPDRSKQFSITKGRRTKPQNIRKVDENVFNIVCPEENLNFNINPQTTSNPYLNESEVVENVNIPVKLTHPTENLDLLATSAVVVLDEQKIRQKKGRLLRLNKNQLKKSIQSKLKSQNRKNLWKRSTRSSCSEIEKLEIQINAKKAVEEATKPKYTAKKADKKKSTAEISKETTFSHNENKLVNGTESILNTKKLTKNYQNKSFQSNSLQRKNNDFYKSEISFNVLKSHEIESMLNLQNSAFKNTNNALAKLNENVIKPVETTIANKNKPLVSSACVEKSFNEEPINTSKVSLIKLSQYEDISSAENDVTKSDNDLDLYNPTNNVKSIAETSLQKRKKERSRRSLSTIRPHSDSDDDILQNKNRPKSLLQKRTKLKKSNSWNLEYEILTKFDSIFPPNQDFNDISVFNILNSVPKKSDRNTLYALNKIKFIFFHRCISGIETKNTTSPRAMNALLTKLTVLETERFYDSKLKDLETEYKNLKKVDESFKKNDKVINLDNFLKAWENIRRAIVNWKGNTVLEEKLSSHSKKSNENTKNHMGLETHCSEQHEKYLNSDLKHGNNINIEKILKVDVPFETESSEILTNSNLVCAETQPILNDTESSEIKTTNIQDEYKDLINEKFCARLQRFVSSQIFLTNKNSTYHADKDVKITLEDKDRTNLDDSRKNQTSQNQNKDVKPSSPIQISPKYDHTILNISANVTPENVSTNEGSVSDDNAAIKFIESNESKIVINTNINKVNNVISTEITTEIQDITKPKKSLNHIINNIKAKQVNADKNTTKKSNENEFKIKRNNLNTSISQEPIISNNKSDVDGNVSYQGLVDEKDKCVLQSDENKLQNKELEGNQIECLKIDTAIKPVKQDLFNNVSTSRMIAPNSEVKISNSEKLNTDRIKDEKEIFVEEVSFFPLKKYQEYGSKANEYNDVVLSGISDSDKSKQFPNNKNEFVSSEILLDKHILENIKIDQKEHLENKLINFDSIKIIQTNISTEKNVDKIAFEMSKYPLVLLKKDEINWQTYLNKETMTSELITISCKLNSSNEMDDTTSKSLAIVPSAPMILDDEYKNTTDLGTVVNENSRSTIKDLFQAPKCIERINSQNTKSKRSKKHKKSKRCESSSQYKNKSTECANKEASVHKNKKCSEILQCNINKNVNINVCDTLKCIKSNNVQFFDKNETSFENIAKPESNAEGNLRESVGNKKVSLNDSKIKKLLDRCLGNNRNNIIENNVNDKCSSECFNEICTKKCFNNITTPKKQDIRCNYIENNSNSLKESIELNNDLDLKVDILDKTQEEEIMIAKNTDAAKLDINFDEKSIYDVSKLSMNKSGLRRQRNEFETVKLDDQDNKTPKKHTNLEESLKNIEYKSDSLISTNNIQPVSSTVDVEEKSHILITIHESKNTIKNGSSTEKIKKNISNQNVINETKSFKMSKGDEEIKNSKQKDKSSETISRDIDRIKLQSDVNSKDKIITKNSEGIINKEPDPIQKSSSKSIYSDKTKKRSKSNESKGKKSKFNLNSTPSIDNKMISADNGNKHDSIDIKSNKTNLITNPTQKINSTTYKSMLRSDKINKNVDLDGSEMKSLRTHHNHNDSTEKVKHIKLNLKMESFDLINSEVEEPIFIDSNNSKRSNPSSKKTLDPTSKEKTNSSTTTTNELKENKFDTLKKSSLDTNHMVLGEIFDSKTEVKESDKSNSSTCAISKNITNEIIENLDLISKPDRKNSSCSFIDNNSSHKTQTDLEEINSTGKKSTPASKHKASNKKSSKSVIETNIQANDLKLKQIESNKPNVKSNKREVKEITKYSTRKTKIEQADKTSKESVDESNINSKGNEECTTDTKIKPTDRKMSRIKNESKELNLDTLDKSMAHSTNKDTGKKRLESVNDTQNRPTDPHLVQIKSSTDSSMKSSKSEVKLSTNSTKLTQIKLKQIDINNSNKNSIIDRSLSEVFETLKNHTDNLNTTLTGNEINLPIKKGDNYQISATSKGKNLDNLERCTYDTKNKCSAKKSKESDVQHLQLVKSKSIPNKTIKSSNLEVKGSLKSRKTKIESSDSNNSSINSSTRSLGPSENTQEEFEEVLNTSSKGNTKYLSCDKKRHHRTSTEKINEVTGKNSHNSDMLSSDLKLVKVESLKCKNVKSSKSEDTKSGQSTKLKKTKTDKTDNDILSKNSTIMVMKAPKCVISANILVENTENLVTDSESPSSDRKQNHEKSTNSKENNLDTIEKLKFETKHNISDKNSKEFVNKRNVKKSTDFHVEQIERLNTNSVKSGKSEVKNISIKSTKKAKMEKNDISNLNGNSLIISMECSPCSENINKESIGNLSIVSEDVDKNSFSNIKNNFKTLTDSEENKLEALNKNLIEMSKAESIKPTKSGIRNTNISQQKHFENITSDSVEEVPLLPIDYQDTNKNINVINDAKFNVVENISEKLLEKTEKVDTEDNIELKCCNAVDAQRESKKCSATVCANINSKVPNSAEIKISDDKRIKNKSDDSVNNPIKVQLDQIVDLNKFSSDYNLISVTNSEKVVDSNNVNSQDCYQEPNLKIYQSNETKTLNELNQSMKKLKRKRSHSTYKKSKKRNKSSSKHKDEQNKNLLKECIKLSTDISVPVSTVANESMDSNLKFVDKILEDPICNDVELVKENDAIHFDISKQIIPINNSEKCKHSIVKQIQPEAMVDEIEKNSEHLIIDKQNSSILDNDPIDLQLSNGNLGLDLNPNQFNNDSIVVEGTEQKCNDAIDLNDKLITTSINKLYDVTDSNANKAKTDCKKRSKHKSKKKKKNKKIEKRRLKSLENLKEDTSKDFKDEKSISQDRSNYSQDTYLIKSASQSNYTSSEIERNTIDLVKFIDKIESHPKDEANYLQEKTTVNKLEENIANNSTTILNDLLDKSLKNETNKISDNNKVTNTSCSIEKSYDEEPSIVTSNIETEKNINSGVNNTEVKNLETDFSIKILQDDVKSNQKPERLSQFSHSNLVCKSIPNIDLENVENTDVEGTKDVSVCDILKENNSKKIENIFKEISEMVTLEINDTIKSSNDIILVPECKPGNDVQQIVANINENISIEKESETSTSVKRKNNTESIDHFAICGDIKNSKRDPLKYDSLPITTVVQNADICENMLNEDLISLGNVDSVQRNDLIECTKISVTDMLNSISVDHQYQNSDVPNSSFNLNDLSQNSDTSRHSYKSGIDYPEHLFDSDNSLVRGTSNSNYLPLISPSDLAIEHTITNDIEEKFTTKEVDILDLLWNQNIMSETEFDCILPGFLDNDLSVDVLDSNICLLSNFELNENSNSLISQDDNRGSKKELNSLINAYNQRNINHIPWEDNIIPLNFSDETNTEHVNMNIILKNKNSITECCNFEEFNQDNSEIVTDIFDNKTLEEVIYNQDNNPLFSETIAELDKIGEAKKQQTESNYIYNIDSNSTVEHVIQNSIETDIGTSTYSTPDSDIAFNSLITTSPSVNSVTSSYSPVSAPTTPSNNVHREKLTTINHDDLKSDTMDIMKNKYELKESKYKNFDIIGVYHDKSSQNEFESKKPLKVATEIKSTIDNKNQTPNKETTEADKKFYNIENNNEISNNLPEINLNVSNTINCTKQVFKTASSPSFEKSQEIRRNNKKVIITTPPKLPSSIAEVPIKQKSNPIPVWKHTPRLNSKRKITDPITDDQKSKIKKLDLQLEVQHKPSPLLVNHKPTILVKPTIVLQEKPRTVTIDYKNPMKKSGKAIYDMPDLGISDDPITDFDALKQSTYNIRIKPTSSNLKTIESKNEMNSFLNKSVSSSKKTNYRKIYATDFNFIPKLNKNHNEYKTKTNDLTVKQPWAPEQPSNDELLEILKKEAAEKHNEKKEKFYIK